MISVFPNKLKKGDKIMVVAPSDSLANISDLVHQKALERFAELGLEVTYAKNVREIDELDSSSIASRVADIHEAFSNPDIRGIFTAFGGYNCNQLLPYLNWDIIKNNPKVLIGFSDTTALSNAIYAKTGLVTYSGPSFSRFGQELYFDYTMEYFKKCVFTEDVIDILPSDKWSDDWWLKDQSSRILQKNNGWKTVNEGYAKGVCLGGNLSTLNLLQGTEYFPNIRDSILFLEDDSESTIGHFDRDLESLTQLPYFDSVKAIIIGRFQDKSEVDENLLKKSLHAKRHIKSIPVVTNLDFGHTDPIFTFPIGGVVELHVTGDGSSLKILSH